LTVLFFRQFVEDVTDFAIAACSTGCSVPGHLLDHNPPRFGPIENAQHRSRW
jgi:hypothetical protein